MRIDTRSLSGISDMSNWIVSKNAQSKIGGI